jgi:hypothetical protein
MILRKAWRRQSIPGNPAKAKEQVSAVSGTANAVRNLIGKKSEYF